MASALCVLSASETNRDSLGLPGKIERQASLRGRHAGFNSEGKPWTSDGFRASWRKACAAADIIGVTFNDLHGTAVTRLALATARSPSSNAGNENEVATDFSNRTSNCSAMV